MSGIVNLRQARKARARAERREKGDANARHFGLSKAERAAAKDQRARLDRHLDGHARDDGKT